MMSYTFLYPKRYVHAMPYYTKRLGKQQLKNDYVKLLKQDFTVAMSKL